MKRGFTIIELLVASLLLGMLLSVLTMVFTQSSIAWRTGLATVVDYDATREKTAEIRYKADNAYIWRSEVKSVLSVFGSDGQLRLSGGDDSGRAIGDFRSQNTRWTPPFTSATTRRQLNQTIQVDSGNPIGGANYSVNVMCAGPNGVHGDYDDIWSIPDDPNEW